MKEKKYLIFSTVLLIALLVFGVSYSFYKARIEGDTKTISLKTKGIYLLYKGDLSLVNESIEPGWSITKTFTIENQSSSEEKYNIYIKDLVNTFETSGYLQYKITSTNSGYNMTEYKDIPKSSTATDTVLAYNVTVAAKTSQVYTIELRYLDTDNDQSADMNKTLSGLLMIKEGSYPSLTYVMLRDNPTVSEKTNFGSMSGSNTTGTIFQTNKTEDGSTVYFYSENTTNNWVKFGKEINANCSYDGNQVNYGIYNEETSYFKEIRKVASGNECVSTNVCSGGSRLGQIIGLTEEQCGNIGGTWTTEKATYNGMIENDIYWRVIRTNEDKSVRLLYSGNSHDTTSGYIGMSSFNAINNSMYVGYMYGTSGSLTNNRTNTNDSIIKAFIDKWYEDTLLNVYDKYISKSAIYCNDRSIASNESGRYDYGSYQRSFYNVEPYFRPSYKCGDDGSGGLFESTQAVADKFSASTAGGGNGQLKYPIALMTSDELYFAGGAGAYVVDPSPWYLTNSQEEVITAINRWWTLSPYYSTDTDAYVLYVDGGRMPGYMYTTTVDNIMAVRPAISLSSCVGIKSGNGTPESPYEVDYTGSCN